MFSTHNNPIYDGEGHAYPQTFEMDYRYSQHSGMKYEPYETYDVDANRVKKTSLTSRIIMRLLNVLLIALNVTGDWIQYKEWITTPEGNQPDDNLFSLNVFGDKSKVSVECRDETHGAVIALGVLNGLGSLMALIQVLDIIGETIKEQNQRKGFQILHGWVETVLTLLLEEIPQAVVVFLLNNSCRYQVSMSVITFINMVIGMLKASIRMSTCKQEKGPCTLCEGCCSECCMYKLHLPCACHTFIFQPCAPRDLKVCRFEKWIICPDRSCFSCAGYDKDPQFAKSLYKDFASLHGYLFIASLVFFALSKFSGIQINIFGFIYELFSSSSDNTY